MIFNRIYEVKVTFRTVGLQTPSSINFSLTHQTLQIAYRFGKKRKFVSYNAYRYTHYIRLILYRTQASFKPVPHIAACHMSDVPL